MAELTASELARRWGFLSEGEVRLLSDLARGLPDNPVVVNIGAGAGTSALAFLQSRPDLTVYSIDVVDDVNALGGLGNERKTMAEAGFLSDLRFKQVFGDSKVVGASWPHGPVDMVFIDGDHFYEGVSGDIRIWLPRVKPGGIVAFHDWQSPRYPDVTQAIGELMAGCERVADCEGTVAFRVP